MSFAGWERRPLNSDEMKDLNIKGEVLINPASGELKVHRRDGRLAFPVQVVEAGTERRQQVNDYGELVRLIRKIRRNVLNRRDNKSQVIQEKINIHLRSLHESV